MPIAPRPRIQSRRALVVGLVGLAVGIGVVIAIVLLSERGSVRVNVDDDHLNLGRVESLSNGIDADGPIYFSSPGVGGVGVYVNLLSDGNWVVFNAHRGECNMPLEWQINAQVFLDPCDAAMETGEQSSGEQAEDLSDETQIVINPNGCPDLSTISDLNQLDHYVVRVEEEFLITELDRPLASYCG